MERLLLDSKKKLERVGRKKKRKEMEKEKIEEGRDVVCASNEG